MPKLRKQSQTAHPLQFVLISSADHVSPLTGATPTVKLSKNGGTGVTPSGAVTEVDATNLPGWYQVAGNATDCGTLGPLVLHATATGADPTDSEFQVVAFDPDLSYITAGTGTGQLSVSGGVGQANVKQVNDVNVTTTDGTITAHSGNLVTLSVIPTSTPLYRSITLSTGDSYVILAWNGGTGQATLSGTPANVSNGVTTYSLGDTALVNVLAINNDTNAPATLAAQVGQLGMIPDLDTALRAGFRQVDGEVTASDIGGNITVLLSSTSYTIVSGQMALAFASDSANNAGEVGFITSATNNGGGSWTVQVSPALGVQAQSGDTFTVIAAAPMASQIQAALFTTTNRTVVDANGRVQVQPGTSAGQVLLTNGQVTVGGFSTNLTDVGGFLKVDVEHVAGGTNGVNALGSLYSMISANKFTVSALSNAPAGTGGGGGGLSGSGDIPVDQDTGGTGNLRAEVLGSGIGGVTVRAYLQSDWDATPRAYSQQGEAITNSDGRWAAPMYLAAGTYTFAFDGGGIRWPVVSNVVVS
jgi:hypothetical protein